MTATSAQGHFSSFPRPPPLLSTARKEAIYPRSPLLPRQEHDRFPTKTKVTPQIFRPGQRAGRAGAFCPPPRLCVSGREAAHLRGRGRSTSKRTGLAPRPRPRLFPRLHCALCPSCLPCLSSSPFPMEETWVEEGLQLGIGVGYVAFICYSRFVVTLI